MSHPKHLLATGLLLLLALIWGSSFILIKKGLEALTAQQVGALRIFSAFVCLAPFAIRHLKAVAPDKWKYLISIGLAGSLIPSFLFATAQTRLDSAVVGIMNALTPLFTVLIATLIYKHPQTKSVYLGVFIGFVGSIFLITADSTTGLAGINPYALLIVLATVFYAINLNVIKEHLQGLKALAITSISLFLMGPLAGVYLFLFTDFSQSLQSEAARASILYISLLGLLGTAVALIIFNHIVRLTNPLFTSSVTYIIPVVAVCWGLLDGEQLVPFHYLGMLLISFGVYITNKPTKAA